MNKKLYEWARFEKIYNFYFLVLIGAFFWLANCDDVYIGKTKEELEEELYRTKFEADSIFMKIKYMIDTTYVDDSLFVRLKVQ